MKKIIAASAMAFVFIWGISGQVSAQSGHTPPTLEVKIQPPNLIVISGFLNSSLLSGPDSDTVMIDDRIILYNAYFQSQSIKDAAGCAVEVNGKSSGSFLFIVAHTFYDLDTGKFGDGQVLQQPLGRGYKMEPGDELVISLHFVTNPDFPIAGPNLNCSLNYRIYGEVFE